MRKKLLLNTISSLTLQLVTVVCGFILPRIILQFYGSDINGLVSSVNQFLGLITFLELGVGAVIQSSLYKPLQENDVDQINKVVTSGNRFFKRLALLLTGYVLLLIIFYPFIVKDKFDWLFTVLLIGAMSISSFAQYYFGLIDRIVLTADQRGYVQYSLQIGAVILNTVFCIIIIQLKGSIQVLKLVSSIVFLLPPFFMRMYLNSKYKISRNVKYTEEPIKQKWNGIAQHIASVVLSDTDIIVLSFFSTLTNVSIYSVYYSVINGVKNLLQSATNGIESAFGYLLAEGDEKKIKEKYIQMEFIIHSISTFCFCCAGILILPFISVYTDGITDANYYQPLFAVILVLAYFFYSIRTPYHITIKAAGHYKQTQSCYIVAAGLNLVLSILSVFYFGLIGVAIGTLTAMMYQTIWMAWYNSKHIINTSGWLFFKRLLVDFVIIIVSVLSTFWIRLGEISYWAWVVMAIEVSGIVFAVTAAVSFVFYRKPMTMAVNGWLEKLKKKKAIR